MQAYDHTPQSFYTQIDETIDFDLGEKPFQLDSGLAFPSQYFSVAWQGFLEFSHSETYRIYVESMSTAQFKIKLNGQTIIENEFKNELASATTGNNNSNSAATSAIYASADIVVDKGQLYEIEIQYAERLGGTKLKLLWESDSQQLEVIKKEKLFYKLNSADTPYSFVV